MDIDLFQGQAENRPLEVKLESFMTAVIRGRCSMAGGVHVFLQRDIGNWFFVCSFLWLKQSKTTQSIWEWSVYSTKNGDFPDVRTGWTSHQSMVYLLMNSNVFRWLGQRKVETSWKRWFHPFILFIYRVSTIRWCRIFLSTVCIILYKIINYSYWAGLLPTPPILWR